MEMFLHMGSMIQAWHGRSPVKFHLLYSWIACEMVKPLDAVSLHYILTVLTSKAEHTFAPICKVHKCVYSCKNWSTSWRFISAIIALRWGWFLLLPTKWDWYGCANLNIAHKITSIIAREIDAKLIEHSVQNEWIAFCNDANTFYIYIFK